MKVTLLARTPDAERVVGASARGCYSIKPSSELIDSMTDDEIAKTLGIVHGSTYEHATFTFCIEGISHPCSHQLVRHRMASYSQQSQRYVDIHRTMDNLVIPPKVKEIMDEEYTLSECRKDERLRNALDYYHDAMDSLITVLDEHGIPSEDIRYFVPYGVSSNITVTMNARELLHFFSLRCCNRAQWEIKQIADEMLRICKEECPNLFAKAGASCVQFGKCPEHKPCQKK